MYKKIMSINHRIFFLFNEVVGGKDKTEGSDSFNAAFVAVPVVLLLLILTVLIAVVLYRRYV